MTIEEQKSRILNCAKKARPMTENKVKLYKVLSKIPIIGYKYKAKLFIYYACKAIVPEKSPYGNY